MSALLYLVDFLSLQKSLAYPTLRYVFYDECGKGKDEHIFAKYVMQ